MPFAELPEELLAVIVELVSHEREANVTTSFPGCPYPQFMFKGGYHLSLTTRQLRRLCIPQLFSHILCDQRTGTLDLIRLRDVIRRNRMLSRLVRFVS